MLAHFPSFSEPSVRQFLSPQGEGSYIEPMIGWLIRIGLFLGTAALGVVLGLALTSAPPVRLTLDGRTYEVTPGSSADLAQLLAIRAARLARTETSVLTPETTFDVPTSALGLRPDLARARAELDRLVRATDDQHDALPTRWLSRRLLHRAPEVRASLPLRFDEQAARQTLQQLASVVDRPAEDALLLIDEHRVSPSRFGARLSVDASLVRLTHFDPTTAAAFTPVVDLIAPAVTEEDLLPVDITRVLATYETSFAGKAGPRAVNIRQAAKLLDGAVILPGETLSFNARVGNRIHGRGFVDAPVIVNDEMEQDVGGGVCQVATTLHAAAVYGNLVMVNRRSHSRPSGYAPIGLDATVIDGKVDLLIRNPYDEPILVHTSFPSRFKVKVELLGRAPNVRVEHAAVVTHTEPFGRRIWFKSELSPGFFESKQNGSQGMDVTSVLRITQADGSVERRTYFSKYYPVPEVFHAGPGTAVSTLPPMPEGAQGLTVDGQDAGPGATLPNAGDESVPSLEDADGLAREAPARG